MSARWYKRCGADFIHGTMMLTLEEKGAYSLCLDLIYDRGGPIADDARWLSGVCGVSIRKWNSIRERLVSLGKIQVQDGYLSNARADFELVSTELSSRERAETGAKGGRKRAENIRLSNENSDLGLAELKREEEIRGDKKEEADAAHLSRSPSQPLAEALAVWNENAEAAGWPKVTKFHGSRQTALRARLKEDGIDGWRAALARARASPFLTNGPPPAWFTFDFIVKTSNIAKLIEGNYDGTGQRNRAPAQSTTGFGRTADAAARFAARG